MNECYFIFVCCLVRFNFVEIMDEIGYLIHIVNETEKYQYPISQDYLIGRSTECNLKIVDEDILDFHCRIKFVNDEVSSRMIHFE